MHENHVVVSPKSVGLAANALFASHTCWVAHGRIFRMAWRLLIFFSFPHPSALPFDGSSLVDFPSEHVTDPALEELREVRNLRHPHAGCSIARALVAEGCCCFLLVPFSRSTCIVPATSLFVFFVLSGHGRRPRTTVTREPSFVASTSRQHSELISPRHARVW